MFREARSWLGDIANAVTLIGFMASVGVSGVLGIVSPTILQPILGLPAGLRVALGFCIFLVALAAILAGLKAFLQRQSQGKDAQNLTPRSSEYSLWQELKRVETENSQLKAALRQGEQESKENKAKIDELMPHKRHADLRVALFNAHFWGSKLLSTEKPDADVLEQEWVSLTSGLIRTTLGDDAANSFVVEDGNTSLNGRLERLERISRDVPGKTTKVPPDFDFGAWALRYVEALGSLLPPITG